MEMGASHAGFVVAAYALSALGLIALALTVLWRGHLLKQRLGAVLGDRAKEQSGGGVGHRATDQTGREA